MWGVCKRAFVWNVNSKYRVSNKAWLGSLFKRRRTDLTRLTVDKVQRPGHIQGSLVPEMTWNGSDGVMFPRIVRVGVMHHVSS